MSKPETCWRLRAAFSLALAACSAPSDNDATMNTVSGAGTVAAQAGAGSGASGSAGTPGFAGSGGSNAALPAGSGGMSGSGAAGSAGSNVSGGSGGAITTLDGGELMPDASLGRDASAPSDQQLPAVTDYTQDGPFDTTSDANTGPGGNYTIFRPEPLGENGFKHSPIILGPGILTGPSLYDTLLTHLASHGFVTICVNSLGGGPGAAANLDAMREGLDWLIAQNDEAGIYQGKLAVDRAVTMGYSIGATASTELSSHEAIITTISIHGHNTSGDPHGPELLLTGTSDVIDDNRATLTTLEEAPAMLAALPIGHLDVITEISAGGRYIPVITAWLRYWVNGDQGAKHYFWGADCEMCSSPWIPPETNAKWDAQSL